MKPSGKLIFQGMGQRDVYNVTAPFDYLGHPTIAGRVEKRDDELSEIHLFRQNAEVWEPLPFFPSFAGLQDPCVTRLKGKLLIGGVRYPVACPDGTEAWQMEFYLENTEDSFVHVFTGPLKMKDIRFLELAHDQLLVLTRPQGKRGGRGKIGFLIIGDISELTDEIIEQAPLLDLCPDEQWVGGNEAHLLESGLIGVLGHLASFDENGDRSYQPMVFPLDPKTGRHGPCEVIARRKDFPPGPAKRPDLVDVVFSGGLSRMENGKARLFVGLSDAEAGWIDLTDPFLGFERTDS